MPSFELEEGFDINWNDLEDQSPFDPDQLPLAVAVDSDHLVVHSSSIDEHLELLRGTCWVPPVQPSGIPFATCGLISGSRCLLPGSARTKCLQMLGTSGYFVPFPFAPVLVRPHVRMSAPLHEINYLKRICLHAGVRLLGLSIDRSSLRACMGL